MLNALSIFLVGRDKLRWVAASQPAKVKNHPVVLTALGKCKRVSTSTSASSPEPDKLALTPTTALATTDFFARQSSPLTKRRLMPGRLAVFQCNPPSLVSNAFFCHLPGTANDDDDDIGHSGSGPTAEQHDNNNLFFEVVAYMTRPN